MFFLEQDILNIVLDGHIKLLEPQYNMLTSIYIFGYDEIIKMKKPVEYYTKNQIIRAKKKPAIIHATTCFYVRKRMFFSLHFFKSINNTPALQYFIESDACKTLFCIAVPTQSYTPATI